MTKRKFTWLDGVIIGVLVLVIAGVGIWYFGRDKGVIQTEQTYEMTLRFPRATVDEFDYYRVGDTMYFQARTGVLGTITSLKGVDNVVEEYDAAKGCYVATPHPTIPAVEMKVQVQGTVSNGDFTVGGNTFFIGQMIFPQSDTTRSVCTIWDIEEVAE